MKTTSDYHGYQVLVHTLDEDFFYKDNKIYRSRKSATKAVADIVNRVDSGTLDIPGFSYCSVEEWFG